MMVQLPKLPRLTQIASRIYDALEKQNEEHNKQPTGLRMSAIGGCERNLWAELHSVPSERPFQGRTLAIFRHGDAVETMVVELLKEAGYEVEEIDPKTGKQWELSALDGKLTGHTDGRIKPRVRRNR